MAQDNRNRNQGDNQGQEWQGGTRPDDQTNREGRSSDSSTDSRDQNSATRDQAEGEDMDELDEDDDRDSDDRPEGGTNRRRSIS